MPEQELLYSVNPLMKLLIQARYFGDVHFVWCAEQYDSAAADPHTVAAQVPPSSNPRDINDDYRRAVTRGDRHHEKIEHIRAFYLSHGPVWVAEGRMTQADYDDMVVQLERGDLRMWRPVLYSIPREPVEPRLIVVRAEDRAGMGLEYKIEDLRRHEFTTSERD